MKALTGRTQRPLCAPAGLGVGAYGKSTPRLSGPQRCRLVPVSGHWPSWWSCRLSRNPTSFLSSGAWEGQAQPRGAWGQLREGDLVSSDAENRHCQMHRLPPEAMPSTPACVVLGQEGGFTSQGREPPVTRTHVRLHIHSRRQLAVSHTHTHTHTHTRPRRQLSVSHTHTHTHTHTPHPQETACSITYTHTPHPPRR